MPAFENLPKCISQEHIIKYDFMVKRSLRRRGRVDNYKSRWFLLCPQALYYCEGSLETGPGKMKGGIVLSTIIAVENTDPAYIGGRISVFQIVYRPETDDDEETATLYIKAAHDDQRKAWLEDIRATCIDTGFCNPTELFHPASFQSGRYPCCDNIDRRASGCEKTTWVVIKSKSAIETSPIAGIPATLQRSCAITAELQKNYKTTDEIKKNCTTVDTKTQESISRRISEERTPSQISQDSVGRELPLSSPPARPTIPIKSGPVNPENPILTNAPETPPVPKPRVKPKIYVALFDFNPVEPGDISLKRGQEYEILLQESENWWKVKSRTDGNAGWVPANYLMPANENSKSGEEVLVKFNWYFGDLDRIKAEELLTKENREGAFLIRASQSKDHPYTLSVFTNSSNRGTGNSQMAGPRNVVHYRVLRDSSCMYSISHPFPRLSDLVVFHKKNSSGLITKLVSPPIIALENCKQNQDCYAITPPAYARPNPRQNERH